MRQRVPWCRPGTLESAVGEMGRERQRQAEIDRQREAEGEGETGREGEKEKWWPTAQPTFETKPPYRHYAVAVNAR